jgi:hypothetical protein
MPFFSQGVDKISGDSTDKQVKPTGVAMPDLKRLDFAKGQDQYSFFYDDIRELINYLVDIADEEKCHLDLMDIFTIVNRLAEKQKSSQTTRSV